MRVQSRNYRCYAVARDTMEHGRAVFLLVMTCSPWHTREQTVYYSVQVSTNNGCSESVPEHRACHNYLKTTSAG
jgi:hypothetical protein